LLALHGVSWLITGLAVGLLLAGSADWLIPLNPEVRLTLLIGWVALGVWVAIRHVVMPLVVRFADLDIALRIEERWPGLNDRLASTVQFLRGVRGDESHGSQALRDATVQQTLLEIESIDFRQAVDPRPVRKAVAWAVLALAAIGAVGVLEPVLSRIAARRFFHPYGPDRWPRLTHLTILPDTPRKIARGMPFTLGVAIAPGERMPSTATVTYTYEDGETATDSLRPGDDNTFRGRVDLVTRPFSFSVAAGDDQTEAWPVAVVSPPAVTESTVRLVAPEYTRLEPQTLAPGNMLVKAVEGTKLEYEARTNKPIASAALRRGDAIAREPVEVRAGGMTLATSFVVKESQPFWLELKDTEGFASQEVVRFDIRATRDEAPKIVVDDPAHDRDVPPQAIVPIQLTADDDFGLQLIRMVYKISVGGSEPSREVVIPLWVTPETDGKPTMVRRQEVKYRWDLGTLPDLKPGTIISFHADARDFDNLKGPNVGKSRELRLRIVSEEDRDRLLEEQQRAIREEADRILAIQKQAKTPVDQALNRLSKTDKLADTDRDQLKNAEMIQRQVNNRVTNRADGLDRKIRQLLEDLKDFKVNNPDTERQMTEMRDAVDRIRERNLGPAEQGLTRATKALDQPRDGQPPGENAQPKAGDQPRDEAAEKAAGKPGSDNAQAKGESAKGQQSKGESTKGDQAKGDQAKADPAKADPAKADPGAPGESKPGDAAKPQPDGPKAPRSALVEAEKNQKAIVDELQKMVAALNEFDTYRGVVKDAKSLLQQHEEGMKKTAEAATRPDLAGKPQDGLTPDNKADLGNLANQQNEAAKGLRNLEAKMDEMAGKLEPTDPLAASALREAAEQSRKQATAAKMGEAADKLEKNQMGQAQAGQAQVQRDLKELVDSLQNRRERELSRLVKELKKSEADLKKLRDRQAANLQKTKDAGKIADPRKRAEEMKKLAKEQEQIQNELKKQMQKLAKLNNEAGSRPGQQASGKMSNAQDDLDQDQAEQAQKDEEEALKDLREAQEEVAEARREVEEQLAMEQIAKMADALKSILERQTRMVDETTRYEKEKDANAGKLTIAQRTGVRELGRVQEGLKDEAAELIERLGEGAPVFNLTLKKATKSMDDAAQRLQALKTDDPTLRAEKSAAARFQQLVDSLKPDKPKNGGGNQQQGQGGQQGGQQGGGDGIPAAAQIKVLKSLQQELNERTDFFDELLRRHKELNPEQTAELEKLHEDQGALADLVRDLTQPKKSDEEN
jgi:hypothetical protein